VWGQDIGHVMLAGWAVLSCWVVGFSGSAAASSTAVPSLLARTLSCCSRRRYCSIATIKLSGSSDAFPRGDASQVAFILRAIARGRQLCSSSTAIFLDRCTRRTGLRHVQRFPGGVS
jgi:hypothetical protein